MMERVCANLRAMSDDDRLPETQRFPSISRPSLTSSLNVIDAEALHCTDACTTEDEARDDRKMETACGCESYGHQGGVGI